MSMAAMAGQAAGSLINIGKGIVGGRRRRREERAAQAEFNAMKDRYAALDTSNPYKNITNTFEDLTVNTQAADFAAQQSQQQSANILGSLSAAAGGGGIAALAQSLANSQAQQAQAAAASIGQQEQRNQLLAAKGEAQAQQLRGQGEAMSQQMEAAKTSQMLGMAQDRLAAAKQARAQATDSLLSGIQGVAELGGTMMDAGVIEKPAAFK